MKLSVFDPSRRRRKRCRHARVWLDGVEVTRDCQAADTRTGRILLLLRDAAGKPYFDKARHSVARIWRHGSVRIEIRRRPSVPAYAGKADQRWARGAQ